MHELLDGWWKNSSYPRRDYAVTPFGDREVFWKVFQYPASEPDAAVTSPYPAPFTFSIIITALGRRNELKKGSPIELDSSLMNLSLHFCEIISNCKNSENQGILMEGKTAKRDQLFKIFDLLPPLLQIFPKQIQKQYHLISRNDGCCLVSKNFPALGEDWMLFKSFSRSFWRRADVTGDVSLGFSEGAVRGGRDRPTGWGEQPEDVEWLDRKYQAQMAESIQEPEDQLADDSAINRQVSRHFDENGLSTEWEMDSYHLSLFRSTFVFYRSHGFFLSFLSVFLFFFFF